jgi:hypothetical protein
LWELELADIDIGSCQDEVADLPALGRLLEFGALIRLVLGLPDRLEVSLIFGDDLHGYQKLPAVIYFVVRAFEC